MHRFLRKKIERKEEHIEISNENTMQQIINKEII